MKSILIYDNPELFKILGQAKNILPECNIIHLNKVDINAIDSASIFMASSDIINELEVTLKNMSVNIICFGSYTGNILQNHITLIRKPYRLQEVIAAIENILSQISENNENIRIGNFDFFPGKRILLKGSKKTTLTEKEAALLLLLYNTGDKTISREEILKEVWGYDDRIDTHTIETHIYRIRQKIGKSNDFIGSSSSGYFLKGKNQ